MAEPNAQQKQNLHEAMAAAEGHEKDKSKDQVDARTRGGRNEAPSTSKGGAKAAGARRKGAKSSPEPEGNLEAQAEAERHPEPAPEGQEAEGHQAQDQEGRPQGDGPEPKEIKELSERPLGGFKTPDMKTMSNIRSINVLLTIPALVSLINWIKLKYEEWMEPVKKPSFYRKVYEYLKSWARWFVMFWANFYASMIRIGFYLSYAYCRVVWYLTPRFIKNYVIRYYNWARKEAKKHFHWGDDQIAELLIKLTDSSFVFTCPTDELPDRLRVRTKAFALKTYDQANGHPNYKQAVTAVQYFSGFIPDFLVNFAVKQAKEVPLRLGIDFSTPLAAPEAQAAEAVEPEAVQAVPEAEPVPQAHGLNPAAPLPVAVAN